MRLITLRRYLEQAGAAGGRAGCQEACLGFAEAVCGELGLELPEAAAEGEERGPGRLFAALLERFRQWRLEQGRREEQARLEMQWLVAAFNQAVMALAEGGDRAAERFAAVGQVLERAAQAGNLAAMRAVVYEAAEALRRDSEAQREETARQVEALGRRLEEARARREEAGGPAGCGGREEGIEALRRAEAGGGAAAVAAVVFDRLAVMEARFGRAVASEAVAAFERERLAALAMDGRMYAWAPAMRVWLMDAGGGAEAVRERLEEALAEPFEYRTLAAGRRVTLALEGRWMWGLLGRTGVETLIEEVDLFAAGAPARR